ncbi:(S)-sulfolactate dehydrogenase [Meinhardsimonia xiamenensis]|jgi:(S)-sulfolactate dehydrogenase|uniref:(S)-sulfolactate dehydrogenase n=1 Tax=Meinhardsimonia xiamenensis TaxID=990712 RepID=A0A1G9D2G6_9RHOB|nr:hydroxyacid dehydrogenase [Meinhardsimonia xiamenensis]PRX38157.1 (S)-sulfolactate dehydrogenase [Meinhardsimonia xiamenensis]SDK58003.1 (S)-sulfolactate dehydrogenase [Meinhardsimonia xiamenensis]
MTKPQILITEFMDEPAVARLDAAFGALYRPDLADRQEEIAPLLPGIRALIVRNRTRVTAALLDAAPDLVCVGRLGVGLDNIDLEACAARGIDVYPATGANDLSVAEYVLGTAMALLRTAYAVNEAMLAGAWPRQSSAGRELAGKTLGLVGFGSIARLTAEKARALGMTVIAHDPFVPADDPAWARAGRAETLGALLEAADVVSLHVPLTEATRHLIGAQEIAAMKPRAVLVNAARGGVVDEAALAEALAEGRLAGAALDVFETEPLTAEAAAKFRGLPNIILTPHIAGVTEESNARVSALIAERVAARLAGA